jgi:hypothetical protein
MMRNALPRVALALGLLIMFVHAPRPAQAQGKLSEEEAQKIGVEAVAYGLPLVVMDLTKRVSTNVPGPSRTPTPQSTSSAACWNTLRHQTTPSFG